MRSYFLDRVTCQFGNNFVKLANPPSLSSLPSFLSFDVTFLLLICDNDRCSKWSLQKTKSACNISRLLSGTRDAKLRPACSTLRKVILANESISLRHLSAFLKDSTTTSAYDTYPRSPPRSKAHEGLKYCRRDFHASFSDPAQRERNTKWWRVGFSFFSSLRSRLSYVRDRFREEGDATPRISPAFRATRWCKQARQSFKDSTSLGDPDRTFFSVWRQA